MVLENSCRPHRACQALDPESGMRVYHIRPRPLETISRKARVLSLLYVACCCETSLSEKLHAEITK